MCDNRWNCPFLAEFKGSESAVIRKIIGKYCAHPERSRHCLFNTRGLVHTSKAALLPVGLTSVALTAANRA